MCDLTAEKSVLSVKLLFTDMEPFHTYSGILYGSQYYVILSPELL